MFYVLCLFLTIISLPGTLYLGFITIIAIRATYSSKQASRLATIEPLNKRNIAVLIPAHNEELVLKDTVDSLRACSANTGGTEIWVIVDNCTDLTLDIAQQYADRVLVRDNLENQGKGFALEFGFEHVLKYDFDVVAVVDADTICEPNFLQSLEQVFSSGADAAQAAYLIEDNTDSDYAALTSIGFKAMNLMRPRARQSIGLSCGIFGSGFALSTDLLKSHPYKAFSITEDIQYHLNLVSKGYKVEFIESTHVFSTMPDYESGAEQQRNRWEGGRLGLLKKNFISVSGECLKGNWRLIDPRLELMLLPLSYHVFILGVLSVFGLLFVSTPIYSYYSVFAILVVAVHFLFALTLNNSSRDGIKAALLIPKYLLWKLSILSGTLRKTKSDAKWTRTRRK